MISKVIKPGRSFAGVCRYLCANRERAEVILVEGVRDFDHVLMAADFESQRQLNADLKSPVQHIILSWCAGEQIDNELMSEISLEYLKRIKVADTQFVVIRHNDRHNPHAHILFNRIDNDGKTIKDNFLGLRGKKTAQQLTQEYGLTPALKKDLGRTQVERMNSYDATRYEIYQAVNQLLPKCRTIDELRARLEKQKIGMVFKYRGKTSDVQGVSFVKGEFKYKGSEIDRAFSYGKLAKRIGQRQLQTSAYPHPHISNKNQDQAQGTYYPIEIISELLKSQEQYNYVPGELLKKKRKRKQYGKGL